MNDTSNPVELPLRQALILWCDKETVQVMLMAQSFFGEIELREMNYFPFHPGDIRRPKRDFSSDNRSKVVRLLKHASNKLFENFRDRVQDGLIFLRGVQTRPQKHDALTTIPNAWGQDMEFNVFKDAIVISGAKHRYIGVLASQTPPSSASTEPAAERGPGSVLTPASVGDVPDEVILALLEEHAKRVVENDAKLIAPGKISLVPIIRRKMLHRAEAKELEPTLAAEMNSLAAWISSKVTSHPVPTAKSLENALRRDYVACKTQSNGIKA